jgi:branched-chain amino acid transport system ATP-binding protein
LASDGLLRVRDVYAGYGKLHILFGLSLEAESGKITVIVGPNGSGKSTLLKTIAGLTTLYHGSISLDGLELSALPPHEIAKRGIAYLPQVDNIFVNLSVEENLKMAGYTVPEGEYEARLEKALELFPELRRFLSAKALLLSGGQRQMLAVAMALIRKPKVMMFDEPTGNLAPKIATQVLRLIGSLARDLGLTVLLAEQNARRALEMGDRAYLLVNGRKVFEGEAQELLAHQELGRLYLGLRVEA